MRIGIPKEVKNHEYRVGLTPESVREVISHGHQFFVEHNAGLGIGADDQQYINVGAEIKQTAQDIFSQSDMIVKVKEPQAHERVLLKAEQILFTYLHLAADAEQTDDLISSGAVCIAYETVTNDTGELPLLKPMSQVAGRMSIQAGASTLEKAHGGRGILLGGVPGVLPGKVVIIGGGVVGFNAAQMAVGLHADVTILDRNPGVLEKLENHFESSAKVVYSSQSVIEELITTADLVIGAVLVPGAKAPKLVTHDMLRTMKPGSVLVDVAIDQGGCFATSNPTTHDQPTYILENIVHYCVANMPGGVARTSTYALNNVTLQHVINLANKGWKTALQEDAHLRNGLNIALGKVTCEPVAIDLGHAYMPPENML
ncbi:MAG: alanine dehydrogenase [Pseudomonadota bacterium]